MYYNEEDISLYYEKYGSLANAASEKSPSSSRFEKRVTSQPQKGYQSLCLI